MKIKRILAASAAAALAVSAFPAAAFAEEAKQYVWVEVVNDTFSKEQGAAWDGVLLDEKIELTEDTTMLSAITEAIEKNGFTLSAPDYGYGAYISDVNGVGETTYAVLEGYYPGWNVSLNNWFTSQGVSAYTAKDGSLVDGDVISLDYAITGDDIGNKWYSNDTVLSKVFIGDELFEEFDPAVFEYNITVDSNELELIPLQSNGVFQTWKYLNTYSPDVAGTGYRPQDIITVQDGDTVYVGIGNSNWPSSYWGDAAVTESVYAFHITIKDSQRDDEEAVKKVEDLIEKIGEVTLNSEEAIQEANKAYLELTDELKAKVSNSDVLMDAIAKFEELSKGADKPESSFEDMYSETADKLSKEDAAIGNEWKAIALVRSGKYTDAQKKQFILSIAEYAATANDGKLNDRRCTENAKEAVTAAALGYDPTNINGVDLLKPLADKDYVSKQGISGFIWSNIAYTSVGKAAPFIDELLEFQLDNGAFSFDGKTADADLTAMALTALRGQEKAEDAVDAAFEWLSEAVDSVRTSETLSQIIIACNSRTEGVTNNEELIALLADYYLGNGEFSHEKDAGFDGMATEQALLAMTAVYLNETQNTAIYDFTGSELKPYVSEDSSSADDTSSKPASKDDNPKTAGAAAAGMLVITLAGAVLLVSKRK